MNKATSLTNEGTSGPPTNASLIAITLYRAGDIEIYGTGLRRIRDACDAQCVAFSVTESKNGVHVLFTWQEALTPTNAQSRIDK